MPHRVLVFDNNTIVAETIGMVLRSAGLEVCAVATSQGAISAVKENPPDMAILAVVPLGAEEMDGVSVAGEVEKYAPGCKVLLTSGSPKAFDYVSGTSRSYELLPKPIVPKELIAKIEQYLGRSQ